MPLVTSEKKESHHIVCPLNSQTTPRYHWRGAVTSRWEPPKCTRHRFVSCVTSRPIDHWLWPPVDRQAGNLSNLGTVRNCSPERHFCAWLSPVGLSVRTLPALVTVSPRGKLTPTFRGLARPPGRFPGLQPRTTRPLHKEPFCAKTIASFLSASLSGFLF